MVDDVRVERAVQWMFMLTRLRHRDAEGDPPDPCLERAFTTPLPSLGVGTCKRLLNGVPC